MSRRDGLSGSLEEKPWQSMIARCTNPNHDKYTYYGGRGISVCERWRGSLRAFTDDMGPRPSRDHSIERINNDGDYEPSNCRWATRKEQLRNMRRNRMVTVGTQTMCITDWAAISGLSLSLIWSRLRSGWSGEEAVNTPVGATRTGQRVRTAARNRSNNRLIEAFGQSKCLIEWSELYGVKAATISYRIRSGMTPEEALLTPVKEWFR